MASRPGPALILAKWVVAPIALGLIGFYFVGPKIGGDASKTSKPTPDSAPSPIDTQPGDGTTAASTTPAEKTSHQRRKGVKTPQPDVDISVRPEGGDTPSRASSASPTPASTPDDKPDDKPAKPRHRRPKPDAKSPEDDANTPVVQQNDDSGKGDQGGSAGSTTAGG